MFSLRLDPQSPLAARWNRRLSNLTGQLSGKAHDSQVLLRQIHCELLRRSDLIIAGYLIWGNGQAKVFGEETVSLFAVLELVIMSARIAVLVPSQIVLFAKQTEEGPNPTIDIRLHQSGTKAAVILCVMNEQGRTRCADGHKEGIILILSEVRCVFFDFVRVKRANEVRLERPNAGHLHSHSNTRVESTEQRGLPAASRQASDPKPMGIDLRQTCQIVKPPKHGKIEEAKRIGADEIEVRRIVVAIFRLRQFAKSRPRQAQRENPALGKIDATLLLVFRRIPRNFVAYHIENGWCLSVDLLWFVQDCRRLKTRHNLIPQLAQPVPLVTFNDICLVKAGRSVNPFTRPAMESYIFKDMVANPCLFRRPLVRADGRG